MFVLSSRTGGRHIDSTPDRLRRGIEFSNAQHMIHRHADGTEEWMAFFKDPDGRAAIMSQVRAA